MDTFLRTVPVVVLMVLWAGCIDVFQQGVGGGKAEEAPSMSFADDEQHDQVVVMSTVSGVRWTEINVAGDRSATFRLNGGSVREFGPTRPVAVGNGDATAGDKVEFCSGSAASLEVRFLHVPSNAILFEATFDEVLAHSWCD